MEVLGICRQTLLNLQNLELWQRDIIVIAGGVIPPQDYEDLYKAGCAAIFGPGKHTSSLASVCENCLNSLAFM